jgi:hypothetical protein
MFFSLSLANPAHPQAHRAARSSKQERESCVGMSNSHGEEKFHSYLLCPREHFLPTGRPSRRGTENRFKKKKKRKNQIALISSFDVHELAYAFHLCAHVCSIKRHALDGFECQGWHKLADTHPPTHTHLSPRRAKAGDTTEASGRSKNDRIVVHEIVDLINWEYWH